MPGLKKCSRVFADSAGVPPGAAPEIIESHDGPMTIAENRIIATAPIRICDIGGWTDTWFAGHGAVCNIAVAPRAEVQIRTGGPTSGERVAIHLENFEVRYSLDPDSITYGENPLIDAVVDVMAIPDGVSLEISIHSDAPPGASVGTSSAVSVALIGALDALTPGRLSPHEAAGLAHSVETEKLNRQCGIQDQLASAYGGINFIDMDEFPHSRVFPLSLPDPLLWELESRLVLVYIGKSHDSSRMHGKVISDLGAGAATDPRIDTLRSLAGEARTALLGGDLARFGEIMGRNTDVQRALHPDLVCGKFEEIIEVASHYRATGTKVNGAGGDGGSITILTDGDTSKKRELIRTLAEKGYRSISLRLSPQGLRVW